MTELTTPQAAERLGVTVDWVNKLIKAGHLEARKIGRDWLVDAESVANSQATRNPPGRPRKEAGSMKQHIDDAIDALIGGNWQPELYTSMDLLRVVREYEDTMTDDMHPIIDADDCADFLLKQNVT